MEVKGTIEFDSIRVYFGDDLHIDIRRSTYRAMQARKWPDEKGGLAEVPAETGPAKKIDPAVWASESFELAKTFGYGQPVTIGPTAQGGGSDAIVSEHAGGDVF